MLSSEKVAALFPHKTLNHSLFVFNELPSTNTFALEIARKSIPDKTLILTDKQTAGRGRLQRTWFSPPGANIYGSLIAGLKVRGQALGWVPLMAGLAIAHGIESSAKIPIDLKWPNDLLIQDQKVGGILCESLKLGSMKTSAVIGFGINVNLSPSELPQELEETATSLYLHTQNPLDRYQVIKSIITALEQGCATFRTQDPTAFQAEYSNRCSTLGKQIVVTFPDGSILKGLAQGIGEHGQLQIRPTSPDSGEQSTKIVDVYSGNINHIRNFHD